jgi:hypothetical protein
MNIAIIAIDKLELIMANVTLTKIMIAYAIFAMGM